MFNSFRSMQGEEQGEVEQVQEEEGQEGEVAMVDDYSDVRMSANEQREFHRIFAMASVFGGWLVEFDVFPMYLDARDGFVLPNGGKLTSYDRATPSFLSASQSEWDRLARRLVSMLMDREADVRSGGVSQQLFGKMIERADGVPRDPDGGEDYSAVPIVAYGTSAMDTEVYNDVFYRNGQASCPPHRPKTVRFSPRFLGLTKYAGAWPDIPIDSLMRYRATIASQYLLDWREVCLGNEKDNINRPVVHTFFESLQGTGESAGMSSSGNTDLLAAWKQAWTSAGWDTVVLSTEDARRHPDFAAAEAKMEQLSIRHYDRLCFYRWFAMAVATTGGAGGYLSDYDAFPLEISPLLHGRFLPNGGKLTTWDFVVPSLVSGTHLEYSRIANLLIDVIARDDYDGGADGMSVKSDMLALDFLRRNDPSSFIRRGRNIRSSEVYNGPYYKDENNSVQVDCWGAKGKKAVHFAHRYTAENYPLLKLAGAYEEDVTLEDMANRRGDIATRFLDDWNKHCGFVPDSSTASWDNLDVQVSGIRRR